MTLPITAGLLIACVALHLALIGYISTLRVRHKVALGDGGNKALSVAIRAHSNFLENAPLTLLLFMVVEWNQLTFWVLALAGVIFVLCRMAHAYGFIHSSGGTHIGRTLGVAGNWLIMALLAFYLLWLLVWQVILS